MLVSGCSTGAGGLPLYQLFHADLLRENKRNLDKAIRELDRERMGLQNQARCFRGADSILWALAFLRYK